MPVTRDLQTIVGRLDAAIAAGESYARVDLDRLRRELLVIADEAAANDRREKIECIAFGMLADGLEKTIGDQRGLLRRARAQKATGIEAVRS